MHINNKNIFVFFILLFASQFSLAGSPILTGPNFSDTGVYALTPNQPESPFFLNDVWKKSPGGSWQQLQVTYGSYSVTDTVSISGTYEYRTRWYNPSGSTVYSYWSNTIYVDVVLDSVPPDTPQLSSPSSSSTGSFTVYWTQEAGAESYRLQRSTNGGTWVQILSANATSRGESNLSANAYSYRVQACNSHGCSAYSNIRTVTVPLPTTVPSTPSSITVLPEPTNVVYWAGQSTATYYDLEVSFGYTQNWTYFGAMTSTGTTFGTANGRSFRVRACNANGCSSWIASYNY